VDQKTGIFAALFRYRPVAKKQRQQAETKSTVYVDNVVKRPRRQRRSK
jgi:hypothetical protein